MAKYEIKGMKELEKAIKQLEKLPQKCVTKAARQGANVALRSAKGDAPQDTGLLKKSMKLVGERSKIKGKKVYQVTFDEAFNGDGENGLVKKSKITGKRAYYPASQEFGFKTRNGGYIPGYRYLRHAIEDNKQTIEQKTVEVLVKEIDKIK